MQTLASKRLTLLHSLQVLTSIGFFLLTLQLLNTGWTKSIKLHSHLLTQLITVITFGHEPVFEFPLPLSHCLSPTLNYNRLFPFCLVAHYTRVPSIYLSSPLASIYRSFVLSIHICPVALPVAPSLIPSCRLSSPFSSM